MSITGILRALRGLSGGRYEMDAGAGAPRSRRAKGSNKKRQAVVEPLESRLLMTTLYWDISATAGLQGGSGTWNATTTNWADENGNRVAWIPGADAVFSATATATVTISGSITANSVRFDVAGYTLASSTLTLTGSQTITVNANGRINSPIAVSTGLTVNGSETLTLGGTNSYSGTTTIDGATLQVGAGSTAGTLGTGAVINNGQLKVNRSSAITLANSISGSGSFEKLGAGALTLSGDNSYAGSTTITAGNVTVTNGNAIPNSSVVTLANVSSAKLTLGATETIGGLNGAGTGGGNVVLGANTLTVSQDVDTLYSGVISGAATVGLVKAGTGNLTLAGANTYTGTTRIDAGTLQIGNGGTVGSWVTSSVTNNGQVKFSRSNALTVDEVISGTGVLAIASSNTVTLTGNNTYTGATLIESGTLQVGNGGSVGTLGTGPVANSGTLTLNHSGMTVSNDISGTGGVTVLQSATLTGNSSYSGTTTITYGTLTLAGGNAVGDNSRIVLAVVPQATLALNNSETIGSLQGGGLSTDGFSSGTISIGANTLTLGGDDTSMTYGGSISGTGSLIKAGLGKLQFTGFQDYRGTTTITSGILELTGVSLSTSSVFNNGQLIINMSGSVLVNYPISGTGALIKSGVGTVRLTGANTYNGVTTIAGGTLEIGDIYHQTTASLGSGDVVNNGQLAFANINQIVPNNISGSGSLVLKNYAKITLTGNNAYSGTTTIAANCTLQIGNGGATGSVGTGNIVTDGFLFFKSSTDHVVAATITGTGSVSQYGLGKVTLLGTNTYTGGGRVAVGTTLQVGNGGASGSLGGGVVNNEGQLIFNRSGTVTLPSISNYPTGSIVQAGPGTLIVNAEIDCTSTGVYVNSGTLQIGDGGTTGAIRGAIYNNSEVVINRSDTYTPQWIISGTGSVVQNGTGTLIFNQPHTYQGSTTITRGAIRIQYQGQLGSGPVINNSRLELQGGGYLFTHDINGTGTVTIDAGSGNVRLGANLTCSGGIIIASGHLEVGTWYPELSAYGTIGGIGSAPVSIAAGSSLQFLHSDDITVPNLISGAGIIWQMGTGMVTLTGNNTYTGTTIIAQGGALQVGNGGTTGSLGSGTVEMGGELIFNLSNNVTVNNVINGEGTVANYGTGSLTIAVANVTGYTGTFTTHGAQLSVGDTALSIRYGHELVLVAAGPSAVDMVNVVNSGSTLNITVNNFNFVQPISEDNSLFVYGRGIYAMITIDSSVTMRTTVNTIVAASSYITSNGANANVSAWVNTTDTCAGTGFVGIHHIGTFANSANKLLGTAGYNPWDSGTTAEAANRSLWGTGPKVDDVMQGALGDCFFLAGLSGMAHEDPNRLQESAVDMGDGTYVVEFFAGSTAVFYRVDNDFPVNAVGAFRFARPDDRPANEQAEIPAGSGTIWAMVLEKVFALRKGGYASIDAGGTLSEPFTALGMNSITPEGSYDDQEMYDLIHTALEANKALTVGTYSSGEVPPDFGLVASHAYTVTAVREDAGVHYYQVRNPWGTKGGALEDDRGYVELTFDQFAASFNGLCYVQ